MSKFCEKNKVLREDAKHILGEEFVDKLFSEKEFIQLDNSLEKFFDKFHLVNNLIETKGLFLRVYERRDKFRYLIKKDVHGKNNVIRDLPSCVIEKFHGYEISQDQFKREQNVFLN